MRCRWIRRAVATGELLEDITTTANTTTRTTPVSGSGGTRYMSPSGNDSWTGVNTTNSPAGTGPVKTIVRLAKTLPVGGTGILLNGTYDRSSYTFGDNAQWQIDGNATGDNGTVDGAAGNYKTIKAQTPGGAIISGKKLLTGLTWTQHGAFTNIWWAPFTNAAGFIDTSGSPDAGPQIIRNEVTHNAAAPTSLFMYRYLAPPITITNITAAGSTYTITTSAAHGLSVGAEINIVGVVASGGNMEADLNRNGLTAATVNNPNTSTLTVTAKSGTASGTYTSGGEITPGQDPAMEDETLDLEGFLIDWTNERIYVRQKAARAGTAPASNEYSAGFYHYGLTLVNCDYLILDGIKFEMFGRVVQSGALQYTSAASTPVTALRYYTCINLVIRNGIFDMANIGEQNDATSLVTIEDNTFYQQNLYDMLFANPLTAARYARFDDSATPNARHDIGLAAGGGNQAVVRRNTGTGGYWFINAFSTIVDGHDDNDWYDNTLTDYAAWHMRFDSAHTLGALRNAAIWGNVMDECYGMLDASQFKTGPLWVVANKCTNYFHGPWRKDVTPCAGWFMVYYDTFWTDTITTDSTKLPGQGVGASGTAVENRTVVKNTIFASTNNRYFDKDSTSILVTPGLIWQYNAFYTTVVSPSWYFHAAPYATEALLLAHLGLHGDQITIAPNFYGINPFPNGINAALAPALQKASTYIKGITNFAADSSNRRIYTPDLGQFNQLLLSASETRGSLTLATGLSTFSPPWMTFQSDAILVNGITRGKKWDFKAPTMVDLGIDPPLASPGVTLNSGGAATEGDYLTGYRYLELATGLPSAVSGFREVTATVNQRFVWFGLLASQQERINTVGDGTFELFRSLAGDADSLWPIYGTGYAATLHGTTATANDGGYTKFTTTAAHGFSVGDYVLVAGHFAQYNTIHRITKVSSTTEFTTDVGFLTGTAAVSGTATQRIFRFGHTSKVIANADNGTFAQLTTEEPHRLAIGSMVDLAGTGIAGYDNATTNDSATTPRVTSIQSTRQFTLGNLTFAAGTPLAGATVTMVGFGASSAAGTGDVLSDQNLQDGVTADNVAWPIYSEHGGYEGTIRRFVPPPNDRKVVVTFQKRTFYLVVVEYNEGTLSTTAGSAVITGSGTTWVSEFKGRWVYIDGETEPYIVTEFISATSLRLNKNVVNTLAAVSYTIKPNPIKDKQAQYSEPLEPESVPETNTVTIPSNGDDHDKLTGGAAMGTALYFLKERHIYRHTFAEQPKLDGNTTLVAHRGCVNQRCWDTHEGQMFLLDQFGPWRFGVQGSGTDDMGFDIQDLIRDGLIDWAKAKWFHTKINHEERVVRFHVALKGDTETRPVWAFCYDIRSGAWWPEKYGHPIGGACDVTIGGQLRTLVGATVDLIYVTNHSFGDSAPGDAGTSTDTVVDDTLADSTKAWTVNQFQGWLIEIVSGTGAGQIRRIGSNTADSVTVNTDFDAPKPDTTSKYVIYHDGITKTATAGGTTTTIPVSGATWVTDAWKGASIAFLTGSNAGGQAVRVVSNTGTVLTVTPALSFAPAAEDQFAIGGVPWTMTTGCFPYVTEDDTDAGDESNRRGLRVTFEPTVNDGYFEVGLLANHQTVPLANRITTDQGQGITYDVNKRYGKKDTKITRSTKYDAPGSAPFPIAAGRVTAFSDGERWVSYEIRGVQTADRMLIHEIDVHGVK